MTDHDGGTRLTHVDASGAARMVDVAPKDVSARVAVAAGRLRVSPEVIGLLRGGGVPKGDALAVARIAGIMATKRVPDLIPLCHPIALAGVTVELTVADDGVDLMAQVRAADRTGVEMEALTAVAVAGLALHDMVKAVDPAAVLTDVRLLTKTGGRSGDWRRPDDPLRTDEPRRADEPSRTDEPRRPDEPRRTVGAPPVTAPAPAHRPLPGPAPDLPTGARARVVTVSDRAAAGVYPDRSGPLAAATLADLGFAVDEVVVVPDERETIADSVRRAVADGVELVVTTGGTGLAARDVTPEATRTVLDREVPGLTEALRSAGARAVPTAVLSRGLAGVRGRALVVNLPGSTGGVRDGLAVLGPVVGHALAQLRGETGHGHRHGSAPGPDGRGPDGSGGQGSGHGGSGPDGHGSGHGGHGAHGHGRPGQDGPGQDGPGQDGPGQGGPGVDGRM
jgi:cyclic pyranopterin phosphate synthase